MPTHDKHSFLFKRTANNSTLQGTLAVYVVGTRSTGAMEFMIDSEKVSKTVESKPRELPPFMFASINKDKMYHGYFLEQSQYARTITPITKDGSFEEFGTMRNNLYSFRNT